LNKYCGEFKKKSPQTLLPEINFPHCIIVGRPQRPDEVKQEGGEEM
jgi:hypothetical protein